MSDATTFYARTRSGARVHVCIRPPLTVAEFDSLTDFNGRYRQIAPAEEIEERVAGLEGEHGVTMTPDV